MRDLEKLLTKAHTLASQVLNGEAVDAQLAEELSGESAEFIAILQNDFASLD